VTGEGAGDVTAKDRHVTYSREFRDLAEAMDVLRGNLGQQAVAIGDAMMPIFVERRQAPAPVADGPLVAELRAAGQHDSDGAFMVDEAGATKAGVMLRRDRGALPVPLVVVLEEMCGLMVLLNEETDDVTAERRRLALERKTRQFDRMIEDPGAKLWRQLALRLCTLGLAARLALRVVPRWEWRKLLDRTCRRSFEPLRRPL
jgi:hypothetical protein